MNEWGRLDFTAIFNNCFYCKQLLDRLFQINIYYMCVGSCAWKGGMRWCRKWYLMVINWQHVFKVLLVAFFDEWLTLNKFLKITMLCNHNSFSLWLSLIDKLSSISSIYMFSICFESSFLERESLKLFK